MKSLICVFISLMALFGATLAHGYSSNVETFRYSHYYQLKPQLNAANINLLDMNHVRGAFPQPRESYSRVKHFGTWVHPTNDDSCMDVRGLVLERDAVDHDVETTRRCRVKNGVWFDPYTGQYLDSPDLVQIDHMVPLKNAYMTGAHEWDAKRRCLYANYMGNKFHLLSVQGLANQEKSDRAPDAYIPPNKKFVCTYLKYWLEVKLIWNLRITPKERQGIMKTITEENCSTKDFKIEYSEYQEQQNYIKENADLCKL